MDKRISNCLQSAYVRTYTLSCGKEKGIDVIEVNNGTLRFLLNVSKALDIMQLWHYGTNISFISKNGFSAGTDTFTKRFEGGMLYTCGLDSLGSRKDYEIHGSIHNTPARLTTVLCNETEIIVEGEIIDTELFGKNLKMCRRITTKVGGDSLTLVDRLVNMGVRDEEYCLLYHVNIGYPFLDEGVKIVSDAQSVIPRNTFAEKRIAERTAFGPPVDNEEERCYFLRNKVPHIEAINEKLGLKFSLDYSDDTLPYMVQWINNASGEYVLGLEPCSTYLDERFEYNTLKAGQVIDFCIQMTVVKNN